MKVIYLPYAAHTLKKASTSHIPLNPTLPVWKTDINSQTLADMPMIIRIVLGFFFPDL